MRLAQWLTQTPTDRPLAWVSGTYKTERDFFTDTARWMQTFEEASQKAAVIYTDDTYRFACQLFGAWQADVVTILPSDLTEKTIERLSALTPLFVTDTPIAHPELLNITRAKDVVSDYRFHVLDPQQPLVEMFTSGSTGEPTRIVKVLRQLFEDIEHLDAHFADVAPARALVWSTVPHQHIYGFLWRLLWPLASGRLITNERLLYPETIIQRLSIEQENIFVTSPAHLKRLTNDLPWETIHNSLQMITSSGGPLFEDGLRRCAEVFGQTPYEIFGSTELDGIAWRHRTFDDAHRQSITSHSTWWHPMPGVTVKADDTGLLWIRSLRLPNSDWTAGSDLIRFDEAGRFELQKRVDRIAKVEEKRISLDAMESAIKASGLVAETKVFQTALFGHEMLVSVAVPTQEGQDLLAEHGKRALVKALRQHLSLSFESLVLPHRWRFEPQLPTDERGKHSLKVLESRFDERYPQLQQWLIDSHAMTLTLPVPTSTPHFKGHFPELAVLPGIAQLHWVVEMAHRHLGTPTAVTEVKNLKFQALLFPKSTVTLKASFDPQKWTLTFEMTDKADATKRYSSGKILFRGNAQ